MRKEFEQTIVVEEHMLALNMGSGQVSVFATPYMIAKMEETCSKCVCEDIGNENVTVGIEVNVKHISATPCKMKVTFKAEVIKIDGKMITFNVSAFDEVCKIGEGIHTRVVVNKEKFETNTQNKKPPIM